MTEDHTRTTARRAIFRREDRVFVIVGCIIVVAVIIVLIAALMAPGRQGDIWVEIAKSILYLVSLAVAGGVVAAVVRDRDADREERLRLRQHRLAFLDRVDDSYSQVKAARRLLRTLGFVTASSLPLQDDEVVGFRTQMATLSEMQLAFEMAVPQVRRRIFGATTDELGHELTEIARYLRLVIRDWEADPVAIATGRDTSALERWPHLMEFTAYDDESAQTFTQGVADRISRIENMVHAMDEA